jgi:hypothetical protein
VSSCGGEGGVVVLVEGAVDDVAEAPFEDA